MPSRQKSARPARPAQRPPTPSGEKVTHLLLVMGVLVHLVGCAQDPDTARAGQSLAPLPFAAQLQEALDQALGTPQRDKNLGISAAVHAPGYATWTGVTGNSHPGAPLTPDLLFDAGSIAKNFEAALALQMAEEGLLDLDAPISTWLPSYPNVDGRITLRQLLNHTSGVFNVFEHPDFPWVGPGVDYEKRWDTNDVFATFVREPYGPPGTVQHYASTNYLLVTAILEKTAGAPVPEEMERRLLRPLNLSETWMSNGDPLPSRFQVAHPRVDADEDGDLEDLAGASNVWKVSLTHPVLYCTPRDLVRWMTALCHEKSVLSPASLEQMMTFPDVAILDPDGNRYGLGIIDFSETLGMRALGHGGSALGYSAAVFYLPDSSVSMAWMINAGESPHSMSSAIMGRTWTGLSNVLRIHLQTQTTHP